MLIIEDDRQFASILLDMVRVNGFKGIVGLNGTDGIRLVEQFVPHAISLDVNLPDMDGWMVLDHLKMEPRTRHLPIAIISGDDVRLIGRRKGAYAFLRKPVSKTALEQLLEKMLNFVKRDDRSLLIVEDNPHTTESLKAVFEGQSLSLACEATAEEALNTLHKRAFDCMLLDLKLPGMSGLNLLESIQTDPILREMPVIVYTGKDLSKKEEAQLQNYAQGIIIKGVSSPEHLLNETTLFLHTAFDHLPEAQQKMLEQFYQTDNVLRGRKVLLVDDDVRNLFALTTVLERYDINVVTAENGKDALKTLESGENIEAVLMDIMMPEMDGYETMRRIRVQSRFAELPIIALTAKAMKGDREKCIEAGASDYIRKPVNTVQLTSTLRALFYRKSLGRQANDIEYDA